MRRMLPLVLLALASACTDALDPAGPTAGAAPSLSIAAVAEDPTPDQLAVAQAVPGFGGYFIDANGRPTVYLTDPARRAEAAQALSGFLASFGWTAADLQVRQGDYSYEQLHAWHLQSSARALAVSGAVLTDVDESANRLRFVGVDLASVAGIASTVAGLGVPRAATVVQVGAPVVQTATLRDQIRPAHGGLQINFFPVDASTASLLCTIGFNAVHNGVNSFVTNSHCSNVQGGTETPTAYYQSWRRTGTVTGGFSNFPGLDAEAFIGTETDDPHYWISLDCPVGRTCRYSDASRAVYAEGQEFALGRVAHANILNATNVQDDPATLEIHPLTPHFRLTAEQRYAVMGQTLNKVGRTTGWTQGQVTGTCTNVNITGSQITQLCQSTVGAFVAGGDSGSPVFGLHTDGTAFLAGILWGSSTNLTTGAVQFIFSPLASVERELGELETTDPVAVCTTKKCRKQR
ncbi:MAG TPA: hypothetical protein VFQ45_03080 [Longimicrobium sp.]|nr:hypothetical protein [Longimicrobium sp.]